VVRLGPDVGLGIHPRWFRRWAERYALGLSLVLLLSWRLLASTSAAAAELQPRIANGVPSAEWPEVAVLATNSSYCSATFIGCRTVLTAAHCVCAADGTGDLCSAGSTDKIIDPATAIVFAPQAGVFWVNEIFVPPTFKFEVSSDLAILKLGPPLRGVLPRQINTWTSPPLGTPGTIVGYGWTAKNSQDFGLKRMGSVTTLDCSLLGHPDLLNTANVCWQFDDPTAPLGTNSNTCNGDSGGPLFADLGVGMTLVGVTSGGEPDCGAVTYSFDTNVFHDRNWIATFAGSDLDSTSCGDGPHVGDSAVTTIPMDGTVADRVTRGFSVPAGTKLLRVGLNGVVGVSASNDLNLYVKFGSAPTTVNADCSSKNGGNFEFCSIPDPAPGNWYALVDTFLGSNVDYQLTATLLPEDPAPPSLAPGDIIVSNFDSDEVTQVASATGDRAILSSSLRGAGTEFARPEGLALDASGRILVANPYIPSVLRIDSASGARTVISGCADDACSSIVGVGPDFLGPRFVAVRSNRHLVVADRGDPGTYVLVDVDPATGERVIVSGCTDASCTVTVGSGPPLVRLFGIALEQNGQILAVDSRALVRIDPSNGQRTILSGCADVACSSWVGSGDAFGEPMDLAVGPNGDIFVTYAIEGASFGAIRKVNPVTGARTLVSGCEYQLCTTSLGSGPTFAGPFGITFDPQGDFLVVDESLEAVMRVNAANGNREFVSGCGDVGCGSKVGVGTDFVGPVDIVVVPEPRLVFLQSTALGVLALFAWAKRRRIPEVDSSLTS